MSKTSLETPRHRRDKRATSVAPESPRLEAFRLWMTRHRGTSLVTLATYCRVLTALLQALGPEPIRCGAHLIRKFVLDYASSHGVASVRKATSATRAYLRYLAITGGCSANLVDAVPVVAGWRLATLPRYIPKTAVRRIVATCDRRTRTGKRDYAVLLLLSRLGLRAGDVANLRLDEIEWENGSLLVSGKGQRQDRMPLPQEVGDAILAYLRRGRSPARDDHVFMLARHPFSPLTNAAVRGLVVSAIRRSGVAAPAWGPHLLRHSLATHMLRDGASLQAIASVLRHRSIETTLQYAKVDVDLLKEVAQPWPEATPC